MRSGGPQPGLRVAASPLPLSQSSGAQPAQSSLETPCWCPIPGSKIRAQIKTELGKVCFGCSAEADFTSQPLVVAEPLCEYLNRCCGSEQMWQVCGEDARRKVSGFTVAAPGDAGPGRRGGLRAQTWSRADLAVDLTQPLTGSCTPWHAPARGRCAQRSRLGPRWDTASSALHLSCSQTLPGGRCVVTVPEGADCRLKGAGKHFWRSAIQSTYRLGKSGLLVSST